MKDRRRKRLWQTLILATVGALFALLVVDALVEDSGAFLSPSQLAESPRPAGTRLTIGGWVRVGSWQRQDLQQQFVLADDGAEVRVRYSGILPDLFAEGEAAVATGRLLESGWLQADEVLAKHDENYRPPGVEPLATSEPPGR